MELIVSIEIVCTSRGSGPAVSGFFDGTGLPAVPVFALARILPRS